MNLPILDAALPTTTAKLPFAGADGGAGPVATGAFEALLAGLTAPAAEQPGAALPPTGKTLPEEGETIDGAAEFSAGPFPFDPLGVPAEPAPDDALETEAPAAPGVLLTSDAIVLANILAPRPVLLPPAAAPFPGRTSEFTRAPTASAATIVSPAAESSAGAGPPSASPASTTSRSVTDQLPVAESGSEGSATPAKPATFQLTIAKLETPALVVTEHTNLPEPGAAKPVRQLDPSAATLPVTVPPAKAEADSPPSRRATESRFSLVSLAVAPDSATAAPFAAPITIASFSAVPDSAPAPAQISAQAPATLPIALPDHRALVDALARARAERDPGVSVALETAEFGAVSLRFETLESATGERGLQVALSSGDPGFERAVAGAAAVQAALADPSSRNPGHRPEPAPMRSAEPFGEHFGQRGSQPDQQGQHRSAPDMSWRESRSRNAPDRLSRPDDRPAARAEGRRGAIFA